MFSLWVDGGTTSLLESITSLCRDLVLVPLSVIFSLFYDLMSLISLRCRLDLLFLWFWSLGESEDFLVCTFVVVVVLSFMVVLRVFFVFVGGWSFLPLSLRDGGFLLLFGGGVVVSILAFLVALHVFFFPFWWVLVTFGISKNMHILYCFFIYISVKKSPLYINIVFFCQVA